jgi:hypothetical protein
MKRFFHTWMWWVSSSGFILALGSCVSVEEMNVFRSNVDMGCAVGSVTSNEALVWVKTKGPQEVKILYTTDPLWIATQETFLISTSAERDFTAHIPLPNLTPHTKYFYRMLVPGKNPHRSPLSLGEIPVRAFGLFPLWISCGPLNQIFSYTWAIRFTLIKTAPR